MFLKKIIHCTIKSTVYTFSFKQFTSTTSIPVRVRFAPSPTGNLHLGGLRTALYNYLFAKKNNGKFILRIEDTDQKRIKPNSVENIQSMLHWVGIDLDEGPMVGGAYGPYLQSQRLDLYKAKAEKLLKAGLAYRCFCSETRLELLRKEAIRNRQNPGYDNKCRHLTESEISECMEKKLPYTIRFKIQKGPMTFIDMVYGPYTLDISDYEGDFIILKSDNYPTYHFACVVDDHHMAVSHVLRGAEWLLSTTKHLMLHEALKWKPPVFGHLPLLVNSDRTKLSKRQESLSVEYIKNQGYEPAAVLNFLANIGGGLGLQSSSDIWELQDLCMKFNLCELSTNSCILDLEKLDDYNRSYIVKQLSDQKSTALLIDSFRSLLNQELEARYKDYIASLPDSHIKKILHCYKDRIHKLQDLIKSDMQYLWTQPDINEILSCFELFKISEIDATLILQNVIAWLSEVPEDDFTQNKLAPLLKKYSKETNLKYMIFMRMLRIVLTGQRDGPGVAEILHMLGPEQSLKKLKAVAEQLGKSRIKVAE